MHDVSRTWLARGQIARPNDIAAAPRSMQAVSDATTAEHHDFVNCTYILALVERGCYCASVPDVFYATSHDAFFSVRNMTRGNCPKPSQIQCLPTLVDMRMRHCFGEESLDPAWILVSRTGKDDALGSLPTLS